MARAAAPMLSGLRAPTSTTHRRFETPDMILSLDQMGCRLSLSCN